MFVFLNEKNELKIGEFICYIDLTRVLLSYEQKQICVHETVLVPFCENTHAYLSEEREDNEIVS